MESTTKKPLVGVISLGCAKNRVDTENILGLLESRGFGFTDEPSVAQVLLVNTCGFITSAKEESIGAILDMARYKNKGYGECSVLAVSGCLSQRYRNELIAEMPEVDIMWGVDDYESLADELSARFGLQTQCGGKRMLTTPPYSAYLRIADGCSNRCAYCAIPLIRGDMHSVPKETVLDEARMLAESGVSELNVIAQDTSAYGIDIYGKPRLHELLRELSRIDGIRMIRLLYAYPDTVTDELIDVLVTTSNIANYLDLPIQHINDTVLRSMNRRGNGDCIRGIFAKLRKACIDFIIRTSVIVGFPGETQEQFEELMRFIQEYPANRLGAFMYSPEEGTPAYEFAGQIDDEVKQERYDALMRSQMSISKRLNEARVGQVTNVLIEGISQNLVYGRSYAEAPEVDGRIILKYTAKDNLPRVGEYRLARLIRADDYDMEGELI